MDNRVILQVPMPKSLKQKAEAVSTGYGFSSLQEMIRVLLTMFSKRKFKITITKDDLLSE